MDIEKTIKNLEARHFSVRHFKSGVEACAYLLNEIKDTSVGIGGSKTVDQLGLYDKLVGNGNEVFWHWREPGLETLDKENAAKVFISSANAIAELGDEYLAALDRNLDVIGREIEANIGERHVRRLFP